jgi:hypothetical protein
MRCCARGSRVTSEGRHTTHTKRCQVTTRFSHAVQNWRCILDFNNSKGASKHSWHHRLLLPLALQPAVGFGLSNNTSPFFPYLSPTLSILSLPALEDLFLLLLSILFWAFIFVSSLPVLELRSFWVSYPPPFSPGDPTNLPFAPLSILLYYLLYSSLLILDSSYFSIPHLHI